MRVEATPNVITFVVSWNGGFAGGAKGRGEGEVRKEKGRKERGERRGGEEGG